MRGSSFGKGLMYVLLVFLAVGLALLIFMNFQANTEQMAAIAAAEEAAASTPTPEPTATPEPTPTPNRITESITLAFAGDLVGQPGLTMDAASGDDYDFYDELKGVAGTLTGVDFSACTLVGTISEEGTYDEGYRMPPAIATALAGAGFQVVNAATDHILDQGVDGLTETVRIMNSEGLRVAGAYSSQSAHGAHMLEVHGVKVAVLSYTYGTGGVSVVDDSWCVDLYTTDYMTDQTTVDYDRLDTDIQSVKDAGADVVVCFLYWWDNTQYYPQPRQNQTELADYLFQHGVDIIVGGGVKTPQPIEVRTVSRTDGSRANCVAMYSLSNLMSCFTDPNTNITATAKITVSRDTGTGETWVSGVSYEPLFMLNTDSYDDYESPGYKYRLLDAYAAMDEYDRGSGYLTASAYEAVSQGVEDLKELLGGEYDVKAGGVVLDYPY